MAESLIGGCIEVKEQLIGGCIEAKERLVGKLSIGTMINGKSAYELALEHGFKGTEEEWLESLKGKDGTGGVKFETDDTLMLENGILSVNTTNEVEQDNTLPITSAGVFATMGNIEVLLKTI